MEVALVLELLLAPAWHKSSYSGGSSGECLEVDDAGVPPVTLLD
ncbi:DUF397 domain-containing protein [Streptomyces sp. NPDC006208]